MFEILRGFSVKEHCCLQLEPVRENVNRVVMFANKRKVAICIHGNVIKDEIVAKYPSIQEIKTKGPAKSNFGVYRLFCLAVLVDCCT